MRKPEYSSSVQAFLSENKDYFIDRT